LKRQFQPSLMRAYLRVPRGAAEYRGRGPAAREQSRNSRACTLG